MTPRRHSFPASNLNGHGTHDIVFYDFGDVDARQVVICVHGLTRNAHDFDVLAEALAKQGRRVFAISMAGRGESAWLADPMDYNYATYVADCLSVMDNFHLRGVEWIGTSMGGIIGMMIAANNPGRIKKLVLNDVGIVLDREALQRIYAYVRTLPSHFESRAAADTYLAETFQPFGITDPVLWQRFVEHSLLVPAPNGEKLGGRNEATTFPIMAPPQPSPYGSGSVQLACDPAIAVPLAAATADYTEIHDVNLTDLWEQIDIPTFILRGAESDVLSADTVNAMRAKNTRAETMTIQGVGHAPSLMTPYQIGLVSQWLTGTTTTMLASGL